MAELQQYQLNGERPWFRAVITGLLIVGYFAVVFLLLVHPINIATEVNGLVFTLASGLNTALILACKWWFDNMNADESQNGNKGGAPPEPAPAQPAPEPTPAKKALPDDY